jgi:hypothetical protein
MLDEHDVAILYYHLGYLAGVLDNPDNQAIVIQALRDKTLKFGHVNHLHAALTHILVEAKLHE